MQVLMEKNFNYHLKKGNNIYAKTVTEKEMIM
jgi:hypothetical protein